MTSSNAAPSIAARDSLLRHRDFQWPELDRFNWSLDHFDGAGCDKSLPELRLFDQHAGETRFFFAQLSGRSNCVDDDSHLTYAGRNDDAAKRGAARRAALEFRQGDCRENEMRREST